MAKRELAFLAHRAGDAVAVAVKDVGPGPAEVGYLDESAPETVDVTGQIPLGHKVALTDVAAGADVIEYGVRIGIASADIGRGDYVHTHNVRSARWQNSVA
jgi:(2R)-sulfolactate sulfo-lyase subunit alpha